jgi:hypothetical protein
VRTLRDLGILVVDGSARPYSYLYIAAKVNRERIGAAAATRCAVDARVEVIEVSPTQAPVGGFKGPKPRPITVEAVLCSKLATNSGSASELGARLARQLEQGIEQCLDSLTLPAVKSDR